MDGFTVRILEVNDVTLEYINWLNDYEVIKHSENQYRDFSIETQKDYVGKMLKKPDEKLYGIFNSFQKHIGNVALKNINLIHKRAEITYLIGLKEYWGKGIGTYAVAYICENARKHMGLRKIYAGCSEQNEGSKRVLMKCGFQIEGVRKKHLFYDGKWLDQIDFGLVFNNDLVK